MTETRKATMSGDEIETPEATEKEEVEVTEEPIDVPQPSSNIEDYPDDEELWEGGPTVGMIKVWKQQFGKVYCTSLTEDVHVVWRPINRFEYAKHLKNMEQMAATGKVSPVETNLYNEEAMTEMACIYPEYSRTNPAETLAGLPSLISEQIMQASGFIALEVREL